MITIIHAQVADVDHSLTDPASYLFCFSAMTSQQLASIRRRIILASDTISGRHLSSFSAYIAAASIFSFALSFAFLAVAMSADDLLEPENAFRFAASAPSPGAIAIEYDIADGYYLYRDKFKFAAGSPVDKLAPAQFPPGELREDRYFGRSEVYRGRLRITLPVTSAGEHVRLTITSQGCADAGVCYPPQDHETLIRLAAAPGGSAPVPAVAALAQIDQAPSNEEEYFNRIVRSGGLWATILAFFGAGLLLAFTPCVLPMVPILSGIIVGQGQDITRSRAFSLSLAYVVGMALTYTAIGIAAALSGTLISTAMQNVWALGAFATLLVALSLSMFGLYELRPPQFLMGRLSAVQETLSGGRIISVALMGMLSAAIVSPCVAAPLAGALLYISQTGDALLGGAALFSMAGGMGAPLLLVGGFGGALLPKTGSWMVAVKHFFGVLLLVLAIWIISPIIPMAAHMALWAALLIGVAVFLGAVDPLPQGASPPARLAKAVGILALIAGTAQGYGALSGGTDLLQPIGTAKSAREVTPQTAQFERLHSIADLESRLRVTSAPVMLDFSADWCVACKEMERFTLSDPRVRMRLAGITLLRADVTANTEANKALLKRFRLFGPPGIVFFDGAGHEINELRVIGFQSADKFLNTLDLVARRQ